MQIAIDLPTPFLDLCEIRSIKPKDILQGFLVDLCDLPEAHGGDEKRIIWGWFERCYPG